MAGLLGCDLDLLEPGTRSRGSPPKWIAVEEHLSAKQRRKKLSKAASAALPFRNGEAGEYTDSKGRPLKPDQIERVRLKREPKDSSIRMLAPECEEGCVEYKLRIKDPSPMRLQQLITQLKYRLAEGGGECFYYLGVEDTGYPKGLEPADLQASVGLLGHMADSLGARAALLRTLRGAHGRRCALMQVVCMQVGEVGYTDMRVAVAGCVDAGKSTLVAVLTHGSCGRPALDSGRGSARMNVFRHKHEVESGRTSSISRASVGYDAEGQVLNYGGEPALAPAEISAVASKLVTFIDMGGHAKHLKTALYGMTCLLPDYALLCVCATSGVAAVTREHMALAVALGVPVAVVVTKADQAGPVRMAAVVEEVRAMLSLARHAAMAGSEEDYSLHVQSAKMCFPAMLRQQEMETRAAVAGSFCGKYPASKDPRKQGTWERGVATTSADGGLLDDLGVDSGVLVWDDPSAPLVLTEAAAVAAAHAVCHSTSSCAASATSSQATAPASPSPTPSQNSGNNTTVHSSNGHGMSSSGGGVAGGALQALVPIIPLSCVCGTGLSVLHAFLSSLQPAAAMHAVTHGSCQQGSVPTGAPASAPSASTVAGADTTTAPAGEAGEGTEALAQHAKAHGCAVLHSVKDRLAAELGSVLVLDASDPTTLNPPAISPAAGQSGLGQRLASEDDERHALASLSAMVAGLADEGDETDDDLIALAAAFGASGSCSFLPADAAAAAALCANLSPPEGQALGQQLLCATAPTVPVAAAHQHHIAAAISPAPAPPNAIAAAASRATQRSSAAATAAVASYSWQAVASHAVGGSGAFTEDAPVHFQVDSVFEVEGVGPVVCGTVVQGVIHIGTQLMLGPTPEGGFTPVRVACIQRAHVPVKLAKAGHMCTIALSPVGQYGPEDSDDLISDLVPEKAAGQAEGHTALTVTAIGVSATTVPRAPASFQNPSSSGKKVQPAGNASYAPGPAAFASCLGGGTGGGGGACMDDGLLDALALCCDDTVTAPSEFGLGGFAEFGGLGGEHGGGCAEGDACGFEALEVDGRTSASASARQSYGSFAAASPLHSPSACGGPWNASSDGHEIRSLQMGALGCASLPGHASITGGSSNGSFRKNKGPMPHAVRQDMSPNTAAAQQPYSMHASGQGMMAPARPFPAPMPGSCGNGTAHGLLGISTGVNQARWHIHDPLGLTPAVPLGVLPVHRPGRNGQGPTGQSHAGGYMGALASSPSSPALMMGGSPPNSQSARKGAVLLDARMQPTTSFEFEAVLVLMGGHWPARGLISGAWPPEREGAAAAETAAEASMCAASTATGTSDDANDTLSDTANVHGKVVLAARNASKVTHGSGTEGTCSGSDETRSLPRSQIMHGHEEVFGAACAVTSLPIRGLPSDTGVSFVAPGQGERARACPTVKGCGKPHRRSGQTRTGEFVYIVHCGGVRQTARVVAMRELGPHAADQHQHQPGMVRMQSAPAAPSTAAAHGALLAASSAGITASAGASGAGGSMCDGMGGDMGSMVSGSGMLRAPPCIRAAAALLYSARCMRAAQSQNVVSTAPAMAAASTAAGNGNGSSGNAEEVEGDLTTHSQDRSKTQPTTQPSTEHTNTAANILCCGLASSHGQGPSHDFSQQVASGLGCLAHLHFRFTQRPEWLRQGAKLVVRERASGHIAGVGFVRCMLLQ